MEVSAVPTAAFSHCLGILDSLLLLSIRLEGEFLAWRAKSEPGGRKVSHFSKKSMWLTVTFATIAFHASLGNIIPPEVISAVRGWSVTYLIVGQIFDGHQNFRDRSRFATCPVLNF